MTVTVGTDTYISVADAFTYHEKYGNTAWTAYRKTISAIAESVADGILITTETVHEMAAEDSMVIEDTTNYDGTVTAVTLTNTLQITADPTYVEDESSGYLTSLENFEAWELYLRLATQWIDLTYRDRILVYPTETTQALLFPRDGLYDTRGALIANTAIPTQVGEACAEMALSILGGSIIYPVSGETEGNSKLIQDTIGPITKRYWVDQKSLSGSQQLLFFKVSRLLSPFVSPLYSSSKIVRS